MEKNLDNFYDMIIVGGGPAGLSASIYMARAKYKTLVLEKEKFGGQITITSEVVNYPGVFHTSGTALTTDMKDQAARFGAEFKLAEVIDMDLSGDIKIIKTTAGEFKTLGVILAPGASPRKVGFEGEEEFSGRGVAYCATCDGEFFQDKPIYVIGGGFAALEEGMFLTKYGTKVHMVVREPDFTAPKTISEKLYKNPKISVDFNTEVLSVSGDNFLNKIKFVNRETGKIWEEEHEKGFGLFVFAGYVPNTAWLNGAVETDKGYIVTDINQKTNINGVYAAGDVCIKNLRQVVTAVSDGATAATSAEKYVEELHEKLNIPAFEMKEVKEIVKKESITENTSSSDDSSFIDANIRAQLQPVFEKFENKVIVKGILDNSSLGKELSGFIDEFTGISEKIICQKVESRSEELAPYIEICYEDGVSSGIRYNTMPGGHEFNSFILALYNVAGPGKELPEMELTRIKNIKNKVDIKVLISLSCKICPDVVTATQRIASLNKNIEARAIDINHFQEIKERYNVMSVPCMVVNNEVVHFGRKSITEILDIIESL